MIYRQPVFQNCHQLNSWTPVRFTKMEFWTRMPSCGFFCVADKDVKSWPSSNPLSLRVVAGWNAEQTEEDESPFVFQQICSSPHLPWYLLSDIIFYVLYRIRYYDIPLSIISRHRKMRRSWIHKYMWYRIWYYDNPLSPYHNKTEEDVSLDVFQHICSSPHRPWYLITDIIFYIHAISYIW